MKVETHRHRAAGFTLVELVIVMAIIVVLAALTVGVLSEIRDKEKITKTKVQVALLENALADYHFENRSYPSSMDPEGRKGDEVLYKHLYHDGYEASRKGEANPKIYLAALDPENNTKSGQAWVQGSGAQARIVDPWGETYRYRSGDSPNALNPDFDLWSGGPDKKTNADPKHVSCLNDIKSWDN